MHRAAGVLLLLASALLATGCTSADQYRARRPPDAELITVLVPGYRGSFLYEGDRRAYLNIGDAFSRGDFPLGTCAAGRAPLEAGGPMTKFVIFPYVNDVYAGLMGWGRASLPGFTAF